VRKRAPKEPRTAGAKWPQCDQLPDERWHAFFLLSQKRTVSMFLWRLIQPGLATSAEVGASVARGSCEKGMATRLEPRTRTLRILAPTIGSRC